MSREGQWPLRVTPLLVAATISARTTPRPRWHMGQLSQTGAEVHMPFEIDQLCYANSSCLKSIADGVFDNPIDPAQLQNFLEDPRHIMMVAIDERTVVGMASAVECCHPDKPPELFINEIGVAPGARRQGIGKALLQELMACGVARGCRTAWVATDPDNTIAQAVFATVSGAQEPEPILLIAWEL